MLNRYHHLLLEILHMDARHPHPSQFGGFEARDWDAMIKVVVEFGHSSQLTAFLTAHPEVGKKLPAECHQRLQRALEAQLYQNFRQYRRLHVVLTACLDADIKVILFKGLWLIEHVYRDPKARRSGDIDLLIHPRDMARFTQAMRDIGCEVPEGIKDLRELAPAMNEYPLPYHNNETRLDVHWSIARPIHERAIDEESIWTNAEPSSVGGVECWTFGLEDNLLYQCFHAAIHHRFTYVGPRALLDIALMISKPGRAIDWDKLVTRAHGLGWSRGVWLTLRLAHKHLGAPIPDHVFEDLCPDKTPNRDVETMAMEVLFFNHSNPSIPANLIALIEAPWGRKAGLLFKRLFPSREEVASQFMKPIAGRAFWVNYMLRLVSLRAHMPTIGSIMTRNNTRMRDYERTRTLQKWLEL